MRMHRKKRYTKSPDRKRSEGKLGKGEGKERWRRVAGCLLVKALDYGSKDPGFQSH